MPEIGSTPRYKSYPLMLKIALNTCLSSFLFGYSNGYFNAISFDDIVDIYGLEEYPRATVQGILTGILSFTGGIGAFCSSYMLSTFTRKQCL